MLLVRQAQENTLLRLRVVGVCPPALLRQVMTTLLLHQRFWFVSGTLLRQWVQLLLSVLIGRMQQLVTLDYSILRLPLMRRLMLHLLLGQTTRQLPTRHISCWLVWVSRTWWLTVQLLHSTSLVREPTNWSSVVE